MTIGVLPMHVYLSEKFITILTQFYYNSRKCLPVRIAIKVRIVTFITILTFIAILVVTVRRCLLRRRSFGEISIVGTLLNLCTV